MTTKEEIQKTVENLVDEALEKGLNNEAQNGGKDEIKSGSPKAEEMKLSEEASEKKEVKQVAQKEAKEEVEEHEDEMHSKKKKMKKSEDEEADLEKADDKKMKDKDYDKKAKKACDYKMKKSLEELSEVLDEEELELIKAWRDDQSEEEETIVKSEDIAKAISDVTNTQVEELKKSLTDQSALIKSLSEQVQKLSSQPAHDKRSIDSLEPLAKGGSQESTLTKSQVLDVMLDLQQSGKGITSHHVAEFETTGNISNSQIKNLVMSEAQKRS